MDTNTRSMWNYRIGRVMGIPIRLNVSLLVFVPLLAWLLGRPEQIAIYASLIEWLSGAEVDVATLTTGNTPIVVGLAGAIGLFASVLLHELGHSWVARRYDIPIGSITLWIFGGVAAMERIPKEPIREFWIAIAGPAVSVALGLGAYLLLLVVPEIPLVVFLVGWLAVINVMLALFNMLPAFPMDGGRIFRALLARNRPYVDATRTASRVGRWFAVGLGVLGFLGFNPILILLALFLYAAASSESRAVVLEDLLTGITAGDLADTDMLTVETTVNVQDLLSRMLAERRTGYPVVDGRGSIVGLVDLSDLRGVPEGERGAVRTRDVMNEDVRTVPAETPAFEVLRLLSETGVDRIVVEEMGTPLGVVSEAEFARALTVLRGIGRRPESPEWVAGVR